MKGSIAKWNGAKDLQDRLNALANIKFADVQPLLEELETILVVDNRESLYMGVQSDGTDLPDLISKRSGDYKGMTGPPLAPNNDNSRIMDPHSTAIGQMPGTTRFYATKNFDWIKSKKGVSFMQYHFEGKGNLPKRDMRGMSARSRPKVLRATRAWIEKMYSLNKRRVG